MEWKRVTGLALLGLLWASESIGQDYSLRYFMEKSSLKTYDLSKKERTELLNQLEDLLEKTKELQSELSRTLQAGGTEVRYQEGRLWMSKLEEDQRSIDSASQQLRILRDKPGQLVAAVRLYKSLKDLSFHFNAYNHVPYFASQVGDVAPELELWGDPVFYRLYLLPLAQARSADKASSKEKKEDAKVRKP